MIRERIREYFRDTGAIEVTVGEIDFMAESKLYEHMINVPDTNDRFAITEVHRPVDKKLDPMLRHKETFFLVEAVRRGDDLDAGVADAISVIALIGDENPAQLIAESIDYDFESAAESGLVHVSPHRTMTINGVDASLVQSAEQNKMILKVDAMLHELKHDREAQHNPKCIQAVAGMPAEGRTETPGKRTELYCQVDNEFPLELANVYLHHGNEIDEPTVDIGVGIERALMRFHNKWNINELNYEI